jgi:hypothetical protein
MPLILPCKTASNAFNSRQAAGFPKPPQELSVAPDQISPDFRAAAPGARFRGACSCGRLLVSRRACIFRRFRKAAAKRLEELTEAGRLMAFLPAKAQGPRFPAFQKNFSLTQGFFVSFGQTLWKAARGALKKQPRRIARLF